MPDGSTSEVLRIASEIAAGALLLIPERQTLRALLAATILCLFATVMVL
jgi:hypothetical protein